MSVSLSIIWKIFFLGDVELLNSLKNALPGKMHSAYPIDVMYSNYTQAFSGLLDYIYFTNQYLELIQVNI